MNRLTENQRMSRRIGLSLLALCLLVGLSSIARAAADDYAMNGDARFLNPIARHATGIGPVLVCGGQSGHREASLQIRGNDVAALWRSAYRMLVPHAALADSNSSSVGVTKLPHKGPTWGINLSHGDAMVTLQTKW